MNYEEKLKSHIWFKELERQSQEHMRICIESEMPHRVIDIVDRAICWRETIQGEPFWSHIHRDMFYKILR